MSIILYSQVTVEDATMAIMLYEESLVSRTGYSVLNHIPTPHFRSRDIGAYIGEKVSAKCKQQPCMLASPSFPSLTRKCEVYKLR